MLRSVSVYNFRGIQRLEIEDLGRVNLIVGANDVGKTSLLEAMALLYMHRDLTEMNQILESRGYLSGESLYGALSSLCYREDDFFLVGATDSEQNTISALGTPNIGGEPLPLNVFNYSLSSLSNLGTMEFEVGFPGEQLQLSYWANPDFAPLGNYGSSRQTINVDVVNRLPRLSDVGAFGELALITSFRRLRHRFLPELLTNLRRRGDLQSAIGGLREFDSRIRDMSLAVDNGQTTIDIAFDSETGKPILLPMSAVGDGVRRLWEILVMMPRAAHGVALVDEIDTGIYYENLTKLWRAVERISKESTIQLFVTTHSWECVRAAMASYGDDACDDFRLIRMERHGDAIKAVTARWSQVEAAMSLGLELR